MVTKEGLGLPLKDQGSLMMANIGQSNTNHDIVNIHDCVQGNAVLTTLGEKMSPVAIRPPDTVQGSVNSRSMKGAQVSVEVLKDTRTERTLVNIAIPSGA